jgi:integrase
LRISGRQRCPGPLEYRAGRLPAAYSSRGRPGPQASTKHRRTLRLPRQVVAALAEHRSHQAIVPLAGLIFTTEKGTALDTRNVTRYLQRHLARLSLPRQRFHDLRHAFATLMIESGEDLGTVSRILGHADFATTADVYAHLTPAMLDRAAERMDAILGG